MNSYFQNNVFMILKKWDYRFFQRYFHHLSIAFAIFSLLFYLILSFLGFNESLIGRSTVAILFIGIVFLIPKNNNLKLWHKIYIEFVFNFASVGIFTYLLLLNDVNNYWFSSMTFCGLMYGLMAYQPVGFIGYLITATVVTFTFNYISPIDLSILHNSLLAHLVGFSTFILASLIRTTLQLSYVGNLLMSMERAKKEQIEKNFQKMKSREDVIKRYIRPSVLAEIALGEDPLSYTPCKTVSSIMFIDMRSYTTHTENMDLEDSYKILNDYFEQVNSSVFKHQGEVDKIMGDAVMATFDSPSMCANACNDMRKNLVKINQNRNKNRESIIRFGTGISYGEVLSANFGSNQKIDRTIVGGPVNIGARLEQLTKEYRVDVLAMDEFIKKIDNNSHTRILDHVMVKGIYRPVKIYEIYGHACPEVIEYKNSTKNDLEEIVQLKIEKNYIVALNILEHLIENCPPHRIWKNTIMDPALLVIKQKIETLLNSQKTTEEPVIDSREVA